MKTYQIDLLNPKAVRLLQELADLKLISIRETNKEGFMDVVEKIRKKATPPPSLEEITNEVELIRAKRHDQKR